MFGKIAHEVGEAVEVYASTSFQAPRNKGQMKQ